MKGIGAALFVMMVMVMVVHADAGAGAECDPVQLFPCLGAMSSGQDPSAECCAKLKEQQPCFCQYMSNPEFKPYIDSPNARKVAAVCGITTPTC